MGGPGRRGGGGTIAVLALVGALAACADPGPADGATADGGATPTGRLTVLAAASLTDAFTELGEAFEGLHPGARVRFGFAGSQQLATQVVEGAPADVFASADPVQMAVVVEAGEAGGPATLASNALGIAVEPGNPHGVGGLADLADPALAVVLAAEQVPAGRYTRALLDRAGVEVRPRSLEVDVRAVLGRVARGEADAGVVYVSDVVSRGGVDLVEVPDGDLVARYEVVTLTRARDPALAAAFVAFALSDEGQAILSAHGFGAPP